MKSHTMRKYAELNLSDKPYWKTAYAMHKMLSFIASDVIGINVTHEQLEDAMQELWPYIVIACEILNE